MPEVPSRTIAAEMMEKRMVMGFEEDNFRQYSVGRDVVKRSCAGGCLEKKEAGTPVWIGSRLYGLLSRLVSPDSSKAALHQQHSKALLFIFRPMRGTVSVVLLSAVEAFQTRSTVRMHPAPQRCTFLLPMYLPSEADSSC